MILKKLSILNYKNIREATLELSPKINCFIGQNGVGKTNVLDAVYYLAFCRSATNPIDSMVIRHDEAFCVIEGEYEDERLNIEDERLSISVGMKRGTKKHFKRNKKEYKRLSEHAHVRMGEPGRLKACHHEQSWRVRGELKHLSTHRKRKKHRFPE